jgi:hypothetical protein
MYTARDGFDFHGWGNRAFNYGTATWILQFEPGCANFWRVAVGAIFRVFFDHFPHRAGLQYLKIAVT